MLIQGVSVRELVWASVSASELELELGSVWALESVLGSASVLVLVWVLEMPSVWASVSASELGSQAPLVSESVSV